VTSLTDSDLSRLVSLLGGSDTAELKLTVPDEGPFGWRSTVSALGIDPIEAVVRQVFFLDTPDLDLDSAGLVVRARRTQGKRDDSVVKLRPVDPADLSPERRRAKGFGVELDAMPGGFVCSATFKAKLDREPVRAAVGGAEPLSSLFTDEQLDFYDSHAPEGLEIDDLAVLGPVLVLKLKFRPEGTDRGMVAELWLYPDGGRILELSTKCTPGEAFDVAAETRAFLADRGIELDGEQQTKTRAALSFFADLEALG
jgi:hypothetical protein